MHFNQANPPSGNPVRWRRCSAAVPLGCYYYRDSMAAMTAMAAAVVVVMGEDDDDEKDTIVVGKEQLRSVSLEAAEVDAARP